MGKTEDGRVLRRGTPAQSREERARETAEEAKLPPEQKGYAAPGDPLPDMKAMRAADDAKLAELDDPATHDRERRALVVRELEFYRDHIAEELREVSGQIEAGEPPRVPKSQPKKEALRDAHQWREQLEWAWEYASAGLRDASAGQHEQAAFMLSYVLWHYAVPDRRQKEIRVARDEAAQLGWEKGGNNRWKNAGKGTPAIRRQKVRTFMEQDGMKKTEAVRETARVFDVSVRTVWDDTKEG